jgi:hypothetical protein
VVADLFLLGPENRQRGILFLFCGQSQTLFPASLVSRSRYRRLPALQIYWASIAFFRENGYHLVADWLASIGILGLRAAAFFQEVGMHVPTGLQSSYAKEMKALPSRSVWFPAISVIICSIWLTACVPGIMSSKDSKGKTSGVAATASPSRLLKPTIPDDRGLVGQQAGKDTPGVTSGTSSDTVASSVKEAKAEKAATQRVSSLPDDLGREIAGSSANKEQHNQSSPESPKSGASTRTVVEEIRRDPPVSEKSGSDKSSKDDLPFKKHDHVKYMQKVKNKAIDQVNKETDATYARLCRDTTTDEWTLWIYRSEQKAYRFVTYIWDEVDEKWAESFKSEKRPISGWQHHLKFSTDGKDCKDLKKKRQ